MSCQGLWLSVYAPVQDMSTRLREKTALLRSRRDPLPLAHSARTAAIPAMRCMEIVCTLAWLSTHLLAAVVEQLRK